MIIECINCNKKFELDDHLIPDTGRLLECGSCSHKWHYKPIQDIQTPKEKIDIKKREKLYLESNANGLLRKLQRFNYLKSLLRG